MRDTLFSCEEIQNTLPIIQKENMYMANLVLMVSGSAMNRRNTFGPMNNKYNTHIVGCDWQRHLVMYPISSALEFIIHSFLMRLTHSFSSTFQLQPIQNEIHVSVSRFLFFILSCLAQPINTTASQQRHIFRQRIKFNLDCNTKHKFFY